MYVKFMCLNIYIRQSGVLGQYLSHHQRVSFGIPV